MSIKIECDSCGCQIKHWLELGSLTHEAHIGMEGEVSCMGCYTEVSKLIEQAREIGRKAHQDAAKRLLAERAARMRAAMCPGPAP